MNFFEDIKREIVFFVGDIHRQPGTIGGFAWSERKFLISKDEAVDAMSYARPGYIGLHRNAGDLSNVFIGGFFKHAFVHASKGKIAEAVSEGVLHRSALYPLETDYAVILEPQIPEEALLEAEARVINIANLKAKYDQGFKFDLEVEEKIFADRSTAEANMRNGYTGFSCTELATYGLVGWRRKLGLYRVRVMGKDVIMPDNFMGMTHFRVVWASKHTTPENAARLGLHEEGCAMLKEYWDKKLEHQENL